MLQRRISQFFYLCAAINQNFDQAMKPGFHGNVERTLSGYFFFGVQRKIYGFSRSDPLLHLEELPGFTEVNQRPYFIICLRGFHGHPKRELIKQNFLGDRHRQDYLESLLEARGPGKEDRRGPPGPWPI